MLDLCELLDLRFLIIADRWDFPDGAKRSVEDLKEHYYAVAHELAVARAGDKVLASSNPIVRLPYDAQKERERKECLRLSLGRAQQQVRLPSDGTVVNMYLSFANPFLAMCTALHLVTLAMHAAPVMRVRLVFTGAWQCML